LEDIGDLTTAPVTGIAKEDFGLFGGEPRPYEYGAHAFGYIRPGMPNEDMVEIVHAGSIEPASSMRNTRLWIGLGGLRVADYPGSGKPRILFDFYGRNQTVDSAENRFTPCDRRGS